MSFKLSLLPVKKQICFMLERMNQSDGPRIAVKAKGSTRGPSGEAWDLLHNIRKRYPQLFKVHPVETQRVERKPSFDQILLSSNRNMR